jgi:predicted Zn-dependent protease
MVAICLMFQFACAINPVSGKREVILMSEEEEREIDEREALKVAEFMGLVADPELVSYLNELGQAMAASAPRRKLDYHFNVVEMDAPNAFALPGGHIYVSRGLLVLSNSEAELANVLGHEIGHVAARHAAQRDIRAKTIGLATILGTVGAVIASRDGRTAASVQVLGQGMISAYGREQEREADRIAQDLAVAVGVDPGGMSDFLRSLDSTVRLEQGYSRQTSFFDTHPSTPERVAEATTQAVVRRWTPKFSIAKSREDYLQRIEGLPIGKPANEGVLRDGRFMHPDMNISLAFPHGWHVENERSRVIAFAPERDAIVLLELQGRGMDLRAAVRKYAAEEGIRLSQGKLIRIGPLDALRTQGMVPTSAGPFEMELTFVAYEGQVYRLSAGARQGKFQRYAGVFRGFARSFRSLRKDESALIDEVRLRLVRVREDEDLAALSERTGNTWDLNRTAVMNGLTIGDDLEVGLLIKVAIREAYVAPPTPVSVEPEPSGSESDGDSEVSPSEQVSGEEAG